jgi:hypothetical protein
MFKSWCFSNRGKKKTGAKQLPNSVVSSMRKCEELLKNGVLAIGEMGRNNFWMVLFRR